MIAHKKYFAASLLLSLITILLDQASKWWVLEILRLNERPPIEITPFFNLAMVWNHGVSFGMFSEARLPLLLIAVALVVVTILLRWLANNTDKWAALGIGLVIGGAFGNVIDRVRFSAVADFLDFHVAGLHWPAFNVADSAIFMGVVVLCIESMMRPSPKTS